MLISASETESVAVSKTEALASSSPVPSSRTSRLMPVSSRSSTSDSSTRWWTGSSREHLGAQLVVDDEQRRADGVLDQHRLAQQRLQQGVGLVGPAQQPREPARRVGRAQRPVDVVGVQRVGLGEVAVLDQGHGYVALVRVDRDAGDPWSPGDARERE